MVLPGLHCTHAEVPSWVRHSMTYKQNVPHIAGRHQQHVCVAQYGHKQNYARLEVTKEKKEQIWNWIKIQVKLFMAKANPLNDQYYHFSVCSYREYLNSLIFFSPPITPFLLFLAFSPHTSCFLRSLVRHLPTCMKKATVNTAHQKMKQ